MATEYCAYAGKCFRHFNYKDGDENDRQAQATARGWMPYPTPPADKKDRMLCAEHYRERIEEIWRSIGQGRSKD